MKDKHDKRTQELSLPIAEPSQPKPTSWEEAIDQVVDERNALLDMLEKVLTTGWELGACIEAQTLVHTLRRQDSAREAEFSGKGSNV